MNELVYLPHVATPHDQECIADIGETALSVIQAVSHFNQEKITYPELIEVLGIMIVRQHRALTEMSLPDETVTYL